MFDFGTADKFVLKSIPPRKSFPKIFFVCLLLGRVISYNKSREIAKYVTYQILQLIIYRKTCKSFLCYAVLVKEFIRLRHQRQKVTKAWSSFIYLSIPADSTSIFRTLRLADEYKHIYFNLQTIKKPLSFTGELVNSCNLWQGYP